jgi:hypothetical protein
VSLIKSSFPLIILIIFATISVVALHGLARNLAQKRDFYSDPLCKVFWEKYQAQQKASHARTLGKPEKNSERRLSEKRQPHRVTTEYPSNKTATLAPGNSAVAPSPLLSHL